MQITKTFRIARPRDQVWAAFQDIPGIAPCLPGAELIGEGEDGAYRGRVAVKLGPFNSSFEGEAKVESDPDAYTGRVTGRGLDKKGGSRSQLAMRYDLAEAGPETDVTIDADIKLTGPIAQFGRTGVIAQAAEVLIDAFARNVEARLASAPEAPAGDTPAGETDAAPAAPASTTPAGSGAQLSLLAVLGAMITNALRRLFGRG